MDNVSHWTVHVAAAAAAAVADDYDVDDGELLMLQCECRETNDVTMIDSQSRAHAPSRVAATAMSNSETIESEHVALMSVDRFNIPQFSYHYCYLRRLESRK